MDGHDQQNSRVKLHAGVATIGLLSASLGFAAEATKFQRDDVKDIYGIGCKYPSHSGTMTLGIIAVAALVCFRVYCPGTRSPSSGVQLLHYLSWLTWFVAMIFYVIGLLMTVNQGNTFEYRDNFQDYYKCNVVKPGVFGAGATFTLTSIILEIVYLVVKQPQTDKTSSDPSTDKPSIVAMC
ncbi:hypothetical protein R6Q59_012922 [Mikania micrantha]